MFLIKFSVFVMTYYIKKSTNMANFQTLPPLIILLSRNCSICWKLLFSPIISILFRSLEKVVSKICKIMFCLQNCARQLLIGQKWFTWEKIVYLFPIEEHVSNRNGKEKYSGKEIWKKSVEVRRKNDLKRKIISCSNPGAGAQPEVPRWGHGSV